MAEKRNFLNEVDYTEGGVVSKKIVAYPEGTITLFSFDKGEQLSPHSAPYDALVQVIEGTAEIVIGGEKHTLTAGESIVMPANIEHAVNAPARFKMLLTMIKSKS